VITGLVIAAAIALLIAGARDNRTANRTRKGDQS
jgi:hypothetical protein